MIDLQIKLEQAVYQARKIDWEHHGHCYGFVKYVLGMIDINLPYYDYCGSADGAVLFYEHYHRHADPVDPGKARPGDVVAVRNRGLFHVGIYLGGNMMAHWQRPQGVIHERLDRQPACRASITYYRMKPNAAV